MTSDLYFATFSERPELVAGYAFDKTIKGATPTVLPTWQLSLQPHEHVNQRAAVQGGPIASYGRVLGDRTTLYKYLNPHLIAYSTIFTDGSGQASVNVVDSVSGSIIYQTLMDNVDISHGVPIALAENWLTFAYTETATEKGAVGYRLVSVELFEGEKENDKQNRWVGYTSIRRAVLMARIQKVCLPRDSRQSRSELFPAHSSCQVESKPSRLQRPGTGSLTRT